MGMTTNAIVNAIEWDLENAPKSTTATTVNQRSIREKHVGPLVERIAQLEGALHHPDDPNHTCLFKKERDAYKAVLIRIGVTVE